MAKKMLIDATHKEEHRVAILEGDRLDDFEVETSTKKHLKGNIYLAKISRIEPSLQAAFVDFGNERHGFLPFSEIHPDYYRIPVGDRSHPMQKEESLPEAPLAESLDEEEDSESLHDRSSLPDPQDAPPKSRRTLYKIQEVIKRRQILLVQVVREERGGKGAALTTYLSLPGRYCILMPNAGHRGGGISRKITDGQDRDRLKDMLKDLPMAEGMNIIVRTAGQDRSKLDIRKDFEYLIRLWSEIRQTTLQSIAPHSVYAEGDLIKRAIRDYYRKDIEEIWIEGEEGYRHAKTFMKTLLPSHTRKIKLYKEKIPLFHFHDIESQIETIMSHSLSLPSGGSIVISPTEALISIDVNSGKSTKERTIDDTALKTNLEAAEEIARQMRLRDLGGLIVIDFIDMNDPNHCQTVEKKLKDACRKDRARIQTGRISQFGLLELSRQRLRSSVGENSTHACPHCQGSGVVRSIESMSLHVLRGIEASGIEGKSSEIRTFVPPGVDLYLLNEKRGTLIALETRYDFRVKILRDPTLTSPHFTLETTQWRSLPLETLSQTVLIEPSPSSLSSPLYFHQTSHTSEKTSPQEPPSSRSSVDSPEGCLQPPLVSDTPAGEGTQEFKKTSRRRLFGQHKRRLREGGNHEGPRDPHRQPLPESHSDSLISTSEGATEQKKISPPSVSSQSSSPPIGLTSSPPPLQKDMASASSEDSSGEGTPSPSSSLRPSRRRYRPRMPKAKETQDKGETSLPGGSSALQ